MSVWVWVELTGGVKEKEVGRRAGGQLKGGRECWLMGLKGLISGHSIKSNQRNDCYFSTTNAIAIVTLLQLLHTHTHTHTHTSVAATRLARVQEQRAATA